MQVALRYGRHRSNLVEGHDSSTYLAWTFSIRMRNRIDIIRTSSRYWKTNPVTSGPRRRHQMQRLARSKAQVESNRYQDGFPFILCINAYLQLVKTRCSHLLTLASNLVHTKERARQKRRRRIPYRLATEQRVVPGQAGDRINNQRRLALPGQGTVS